MMLPFLQDKQAQAETAVKAYLDLKKSNAPAWQVNQAESNAVASLVYLVNRFAKKYRNDIAYEDIKLSAYEAIVKALRTYDESKSDSFTYWLQLHSIGVHRAARKSIDHTQMVQELGPSLFDRNRCYSAEQKCIIQQALDRMPEPDYQLLKAYLETESLEAVAQLHGISKQAVHERIKRIINRLRP